MDKLIKINKLKDEMIFGNIPYPNIHNLYDKKQEYSQHLRIL